MSTSRDLVIDYLRFLGLTLIILAHCNPPECLFQIRTFDVPLMLYVSGLAYAGKTIGNLRKFYIGRTLRLLIPVYLFLALFLPVYAWLQGDNLKVDRIYSSLNLTGGIGYVWIIRVFLLVMLITPLCLFVTKCKTELHRWIAGAIVLVAYFLYNTYVAPWKTDSVWTQYIIPYVIGYGILFTVGNLTYKSNTLFRMALMSVFGGISVYFALDSGFAPQKAKYPPRDLFLAYGIFCSVFLYSLASAIKCKSDVTSFASRIVEYISSRTIWIYLWHIPLVLYLPLDLQWIYKFVITYAVALAATYLQNRMMYFYISRRGNAWWCKYLIS